MCVQPHKDRSHPYGYHPVLGRQPDCVRSTIKRSRPSSPNARPIASINIDGEVRVAIGKLGLGGWSELPDASRSTHAVALVVEVDEPLFGQS